MFPMNIFAYFHDIFYIYIENIAANC